MFSSNYQAWQLLFGFALAVGSLGTVLALLAILFFLRSKRDSQEMSWHKLLSSHSVTKLTSVPKVSSFDEQATQLIAHIQSSSKDYSHMKMPTQYGAQNPIEGQVKTLVALKNTSASSLWQISLVQEYSIAPVIQDNGMIMLCWSSVKHGICMETYFGIVIDQLQTIWHFH